MCHVLCTSRGAGRTGTTVTAPTSRPRLPAPRRPSSRCRDATRDTHTPSRMRDCWPTRGRRTSR